MCSGQSFAYCGIFDSVYSHCVNGKQIDTVEIEYLVTDDVIEIKTLSQFSQVHLQGGKY